MIIWLLSDYDHRKHLASNSLIARYTASYPDHPVKFSVKSRHSLWESLFAHLRDPKRNPLADVMELPQNWTELFAKLGLLSDLSTSIEALSQPRYPEFVLKELCRDEGNRAYSAPWWLEAPALFYRSEERRVGKECRS